MKFFFLIVVILVINLAEKKYFLDIWKVAQHGGYKSKLWGSNLSFIIYYLYDL